MHVVFNPAVPTHARQAMSLKGKRDGERRRGGEGDGMSSKNSPKHEAFVRYRRRIGRDVKKTYHSLSHFPTPGQPQPRVH